MDLSTFTTPHKVQYADVTKENLLGETFKTYIVSWWLHWTKSCLLFYVNLTLETNCRKFWVVVSLFAKGEVFYVNFQFNCDFIDAKGFLNTFFGNLASLRPAYHGLWKKETLFRGGTSLVQRLLALVKFERSRVVAMKIRANFAMLSLLDGSYQLGNDTISIERTVVCQKNFVLIYNTGINKYFRRVNWVNQLGAE